MNSSRVNPSSAKHLAEVFVDEPDGELVVAGGDGGVGGENVIYPHHVFRLRKGLALPDEFADAFHSQESRVTFVHVPDGWGDTQQCQCLSAAHAQQDLLGDADLQVAAVEFLGQQPVHRVVLIKVGIQQVKMNAPDFQFPDARRYFAPGQINSDGEGFVILIKQMR